MITRPLRIAWHWLTRPAGRAPRRLTVLVWSLLWLFEPGITHLLTRYGTVIEQVLDVVIPAMVLAIGVRFLTLWRRSERRL